MTYALQQELERAAASVEVSDGDLDAVIRRARRRNVRRRHYATLVVGALSATVAVLLVNTSRMPSLRTVAAPSSETSGPTVNPVLYDDRKPTRAGLFRYFARPLPGVELVNRVAVKKATWGQVAPLLRRTYELGSEPDMIGGATEVTYVVVQSGVLSTPAGRPGEEMTGTYTVIVFAAEGGRPLLHLNRPDRQAWPAFFDELEDQGGE